MHAALEFCTRILFVFTLIITVGTMFLLAFVKCCKKIGLSLHKPGSTRWFSEFLKNFT